MVESSAKPSPRLSSRAAEEGSLTPASRNGGGEGDSRFGAANAAIGDATDVALELERGVDLDEALEADVDELVSKNRNVCSNGVLLESLK